MIMHKNNNNNARLTQNQQMKPGSGGEIKFLHARTHTRTHMSHTFTTLPRDNFRKETLFEKWLHIKRKFCFCEHKTKSMKTVYIFHPLLGRKKFISWNYTPIQAPQILLGLLKPLKASRSRYDSERKQDSVKYLLAKYKMPYRYKSLQLCQSIENTGGVRGWLLLHSIRHKPHRVDSFGQLTFHQFVHSEKYGFISAWHHIKQIHLINLIPCQFLMWGKSYGTDAYHRKD